MGDMKRNEMEMEERSIVRRVEAAGELKLQVDNGIPLSDYYHLASDLLHQADMHRKNKTTGELCIVLSRFSSLVLGVIPKHRDYNQKHRWRRHHLSKKARGAKEELKSLKTEIWRQLDDAGLPVENEEEQLLLLDKSSTPLDGPGDVPTPDRSSMDGKDSEDNCKITSTPSNDSSLESDHLQAKADVLVSDASPSMELNGEVSPNYAQLEILTADIANLSQEIFGLINSCQQSDKEAKEAAIQAKRYKNLFKREVRQREKVEQLLRDLLLKLEELRNQRDHLRNDLTNIQDEMMQMETKVIDLEDKLINSETMKELIREERDSAREERKLLHLNMVPMGSEMLPDIQNFSLIELEQATCGFDSDFKIGEGRFTCVYRGFVRNTCVAIKRFDEQCFEVKSNLDQELELLGKVRHPHFVSIIGYCSEASCLVYELLSNGSLEDLLARGSSKPPPLSFSFRFRIAAEICSALIFLHSCNPALVHGNLKATNIFPDENLGTKLSDLRSSLCVDCNSEGDHPDELVASVDPEYFEEKELTTQSDVFSLGIIILRLLTGLPASVVVEVVTDAVKKDLLLPILDDSAGEWPFIQASQLANLGLRCCQRRPSDRPELEGEVWKILEPLAKASSSHLQRGDVPSYFMCPILQEVMKEPHIASDGFTYEVEAMKAWIDGGHNTSPMTNMELSSEQLIPNRALKSAIHEWMQR